MIKKRNVKFLICLNTVNKSINIDLLLERINFDYYKGDFKVNILNFSGGDLEPITSKDNYEIISMGKSGSLADNWNELFKFARNCDYDYDYFLFLHDDDIYNRNFLNSYNEEIGISPFDVGFCECNMVNIENKRLHLSEFTYKKLNVTKRIDFENKQEVYESIYKHGYYFRTPSLCVKKHIVEYLLCSNDSGAAADVELLTKLPDEVKLSVMPFIGFNYLIHSNSETNKSIKTNKINKEKWAFSKIEDNFGGGSPAMIERRLFFISTMFIKNKRTTLLKLVFKILINSSIRKRAKFILLLRFVYAKTFD